MRCSCGINRLYRCIAMVCLFVLLLSFSVEAQLPIAQDAYAVFEQSCLICHGAEVPYKESLFIDRDALIETGAVVLGSPGASELYRRLVTTGVAKRMPFNQPRLSAPPRVLVRRGSVSLVVGSRSQRGAGGRYPGRELGWCRA